MASLDLALVSCSDTLAGSFDSLDREARRISARFRRIRIGLAAPTRAFCTPLHSILEVKVLGAQLAVVPHLTGRQLRTVDREANHEQKRGHERSGDAHSQGTTHPCRRLH